MFKVGDRVRVETYKNNSNGRLVEETGTIAQQPNDNDVYIGVDVDRIGWGIYPTKALHKIEIGCPHADLIKEYAEDCLKYKEPWLLWEWYSLEDKLWEVAAIHPMWFPEMKYRKKPRTININGYEVPEPLRIAPSPDTTVYAVGITHTKFIMEHTYDNARYWHKQLLNKGLLHLTKEAAELHAKALLSFTIVNKE